MFKKKKNFDRVAKKVREMNNVLQDAVTLGEVEKEKVDISIAGAHESHESRIAELKAKIIEYEKQIEAEIKAKHDAHLQNIDLHNKRKQEITSIVKYASNILKTFGETP